MFGSGIKRLRTTRSITQQELAKKLSVSRQAVCMWEGERREITAKMLSKIARFFNVSLNELTKSGVVKTGVVRNRKEEGRMKKAAVIKSAQKKVKFEITAPEAKKVMLVGDFNSWDETATALKKSKKGLWKTDLSLDQGRYEYKFVVDGEWWTDPSNSYTVTNVYGSQNSVREI